MNVPKTTLCRDLDRGFTPFRGGVKPCDLQFRNVYKAGLVPHLRTASKAFIHLTSKDFTIFRTLAALFHISIPHQHYIMRFTSTIAVALTLASTGTDYNPVYTVWTID